VRDKGGFNLNHPWFDSELFSVFSKAEVSVVLKNAGHSAHKPEVFGDRIKVIRTFTRQGASSYKILSQNGDLISTHKADLQRICDQLEIQVDNPLNILTQGTLTEFPLRSHR